MPAGGVMLWSILAAIGAYVFLGSGPGIAWFGAYLALIVGSLAFDAVFRPPEPPDGAALTSGGLALLLTALNFIAASAVIFGILAYALAALRGEQAKTDRLLLNILPAPIAERMRTGESTIADSFDEVTILFADVVGFTRLAAARPADQIVRLLNRIFTAFDELADRWDVEKIKTIGDAYMVASGLPLARDDHAAVVAEVAIAMREAVRRIADEQGLVLELRIGVHTGPVVAGIIGLKKFAYDVWGDTVNVASRMETSAPAGSIQVSKRTARRLEPLYALSSCAPVALRGLGPVTTYLLEGRKPELEEDAFPRARNARSNVVELARSWSRSGEEGRAI